MIVLASFLIPVLAFFFESYPRFKNRLFGVDIWTHLLYLKEYQIQKGIPGKITNGFLVHGEYDYPPAFILILSRLPFQFVEKYEFLFSPFFDALHILFMYYCAYFFTGNIVVALLTQCLYVLTPIIVLENSSATPRSLGYLLFSIVFTFLFLFHNTHVPLYIIIAILAGTCIFLSHRFTTQGFLFFSILLTLIEKDLTFFGTFFLSFLLAVSISGKFYLKVLRGHVGNLKFWYKNIDYRFAHQVKGNYALYKTKDFVFRLYNQFLKFPPFILAITNPWVLFSFSFFYVSQRVINFEYQLLLWVLISYVISLITIWIPKLRFLGEGQRYLELSAFPAAFLSAETLVILLHSKFSFFAVVLYIVIAFSSFITIIIIQRKAIIRDTLRTITPSMRAMFTYLKNIRVKPKLLCIPHQITTNIIYHTGCPVLVNASYANIDQISDIYPYIKKPISIIMNKYNLDMILLNEHYASLDELHIKKYKVIKKIENFILIQVL